jgi:hypothetical protein
MRLVRDIIGDTLEVAPEQINVTLEGVLTKERIGRTLSNAELIDKAASIINGLTYVKNLDEISHLPQKSYAQQAEMIVRYGAGCHLQYLPAEQAAECFPDSGHGGILQADDIVLILIVWDNGRLDLFGNGFAARIPGGKDKRQGADFGLNE